MSKTNENKGIKSKNEIKDTKKTSRIILIIIMIIVLLVIIGISIFFLLKSTRKVIDNKIEETSQEEDAEERGVSLFDYENMNNVELVEGKKINNSKALLEEKTFKGLKVKDIKLEEIKGTTNFSAKLENNTQEDFKSCIIVLVFTNKDGTEYARLEASIPDISKGKSTILDASTTSDLTNAFNFRIEEI